MLKGKSIFRVLVIMFFAGIASVNAGPLQAANARALVTDVGGSYARCLLWTHGGCYYWIYE